MSLTKNISGLKEISQINFASLEPDIFTELERERVNWNVPTTRKDDTNDPHQEQIDACFSRIIALSLNLELPIGAFNRCLLEREKELPISAKIGIIKNIEDEEKHQKAFENIAKTYKVTKEDLNIANEYRKYLIKSSTHPLIKSRDLETIVFIALQTCLRYFGSQSLERLIAYISLDEFRHLQYGWELSNILNLGFDREFEDQLVEICKWSFQPLRDTRLNSAFWVNGVLEMRETGESTLFNDLMSYGVVIAPFELSNAYY